MLYGGLETLTHTHMNERGAGSNKTNKEIQINKYEKNCVTCGVNRSTQWSSFRIL